MVNKEKTDLKGIVLCCARTQVYFRLNYHHRHNVPEVYSVTSKIDYLPGNEIVVSGAVLDKKRLLGDNIRLTIGFNLRKQIPLNWGWTRIISYDSLRLKKDKRPVKTSNVQIDLDSLDQDIRVDTHNCEILIHGGSQWINKQKKIIKIIGPADASDQDSEVNPVLEVKAITKKARSSSMTLAHLLSEYVPINSAFRFPNWNFLKS